MSKFILGDCMDKEIGLPSYPDNYFDLAIADPPYGIMTKLNFRFEKNYENTPPPRDYFIELIRVSKNQIIWGGNYFTDKLAVSRGWICWQKGQPVDNFSDFELAWTSYNKVSKNIKLDSYGFNHADTKNGFGKAIHPTQKPVVLYEYLLREYAQKGFKILDTHVGSASSLIAFERHGFDYVGYEIDPEYYKSAQNRIKKGIQKILL